MHESLIERFSIQMSHEMITAAFTHVHAYADILHAKKRIFYSTLKTCIFTGFSCGCNAFEIHYKRHLSCLVLLKNDTNVYPKEDLQRGCK